MSSAGCCKAHNPTWPEGKKRGLGKLSRGSDRSSPVGESGKDVLGKGTIMSKDTAAWNCVIYSGNCKSCSRSWEDAYGRAREDKFGEVGWGWIKRASKYFISLNLFHLKGILS